MKRPRRGFALLAVLWVIVALAALAAGAVERARADAAVTGDQVARIRARWAAEGCLAVAQSRIEAALRRGQPLALPASDTLYYANGARCTADGFDPAARLHRDSASVVELGRLDSALAWASGESQQARDSFLTSYGDGRINVNVASEPVLATLPGVGPEVLRVIRESRAWNRPLSGLDELAGRLSPSARAELLDHYGELAGSTSFQTSALALDAHGWTEGSRARSTIEILVVNGGNRAAIVRRRMW